MYDPDENEQLREMTESEQWQDWLSRDKQYLEWLDTFNEEYE